MHKITPRIERMVIRLMDSGELETCGQAATIVSEVGNQHVSRWTIMRALHRNEIHNYARPLKPRLLAHHILKRYTWARYLRTSTCRHWECVVFTDEARINLYGPDSRPRVWRRAGILLQPRHVRQTVKHGGGHVMIWGAITSKGVGQIALVRGKMDSRQYVRILESSYAATLDMHHLDRTHTWMQCDNDPKHTSKYTRTWLHQAGIYCIPWPSCSPDMNPIEHVWAYMRTHLRALSCKPQTMDELWQKIQNVWYSIPQSFISNLYDSMPRRISALVAAKGRHTKY